MKLNLLTAAIAVTGLTLFANSANAAMTTDKHGNVGYDTYDECVAAVQDGTAKFHTPYTYQKPKRWAGETSVSQMKLSDVQIPAGVANSMSFSTQDYSAGACDRGVGQSHGRYGVSGILVGKYVPFAPDMNVNVYKNRAGTPVRITMQQCDNHFGAKFPMPILATKPAPAPAAQLAIKEEVTVEPVVIKESRTIRPSQSNQYRVKQVIVAPEAQIHQVRTENGTVVAVENGAKQAVVLGKRVDPALLEEATVEGSVPVIEVPNNNATRVYNPATGQYEIVE